MRVSRHDPEFQRRVVELHRQGLSSRKIGKELGCGHNVVLEALRCATNPVNPPPSPPKEEPPRQKPWEDVLADAVRRLPAPVEPPKIEPPRCDPEEMVLILGDIHTGLYVNPEATDNVYAYNRETFLAQVRQYKKAISSIIKIERPSVGWRKCWVLLVGDLVHGDNMRAEQITRVSSVVTEQVLDLITVVSDEILLWLLEQFEEVEVHGVPGNHGRVTQEPGIAGSGLHAAHQNWDWLALKLMETRIHDPRIKWHIPKSMFARVEIMGHTFVIEHGGGLKGGAMGAFGGIPWYGIDRVMASYIGILKERPKYLCLGHVHRSAVISMPGDGLAIVNGAWPAACEWALTEKKMYTRPVQLLLSVHPRQGVTQIRRIYLD